MTRQRGARSCSPRSPACSPVVRRRLGGPRGNARKEVFHLGLLVLPALALTVAVGGLVWKRDAVARERALEAQRAT